MSPRRAPSLVASLALASTLVLTAGLQAMAVDYTPSTQNPALPQSCGLKLAIVLDLSNSVTDTDLAQAKKAAQGAVSALEGTASQVGLATFATFAPVDGQARDASSTATSSQVAEINTWIGGLTRPISSQGGTNWDQGLAQLEGQGYQAVLFVTDGKPTAYGEPSSSGSNRDFGSQTDDKDINYGIDSANALKAEQTTVIAVGVGSSIDSDNLKRISGPVQNQDYYLAPGFAQLETTLSTAARAACAGTVSVTKLVDLADGTDPVAAPGWTFKAAGSVQGEATTNEDGVATFGYTGGADTVTITETQQPGYSLSPQEGFHAVCQLNQQPVAVTNTTDGFSFDKLKSTDVATCTVINKRISSTGDPTIINTVAASTDPTDSGEPDPTDLDPTDSDPTDSDPTDSDTSPAAPAPSSPAKGLPNTGASGAQQAPTTAGGDRVLSGMVVVLGQRVRVRQRSLV